MSSLAVVDVSRHICLITFLSNPSSMFLHKVVIYIAIQESDVVAEAHSFVERQLNIRIIRLHFYQFEIITLAE